ncbi:MAG TPA: hypothetical protein PKH02_02165 [Bacteroidales bacterium]|nr:hypothetical protein [Bacteroidales bacterium]HPT11231.1 hypothetical protein [Bacteroidales bacterium]
MLKALIINLLIFVHPVHVTITTINQAQDSDTMNVFFRMYYDDFQRDYKLYYPDYNPGEESDTTGFPREMLIRYFNDRVRINVDNRLLPGRIAGYSVDSYEIRINLTYESFKNPRKIRISNRILTTLYDDQANMVYLNIGKYQNAISLTPGKDEESIIIK